MKIKDKIAHIEARRRLDRYLEAIGHDKIVYYDSDSIYVSSEALIDECESEEEE